jgi:hypothetical protein
METAILNKYPCVGKYLCARPTLKHVLLRKFGRYSILLSQDIVRRHSASPHSLSFVCVRVLHSFCLSPVESEDDYHLWNILFVYW